MEQLIRTIDALDRRIFLTVHLWQAKPLRQILRLLTHLGDLPFQILLILILSGMPHTRPIGLRLLIAQLSVTIVVQVGKHAIARTRPYNAISGITPFKVETDSSFPSGHTAAAFTAAIVMGCFYPAAQPVLLALAGCIGYSRIYIGVHYLTDVIAGCGIGMVVSSLVLLVCSL